MYQIFFTKQAAKDKRLIAQAGLERRVKALLAVLSENPLNNKTSPNLLPSGISSDLFWWRQQNSNL